MQQYLKLQSFRPQSLELQFLGLQSLKLQSLALNLSCYTIWGTESISCLLVDENTVLAQTAFKQGFSRLLGIAVAAVPLFSIMAAKAGGDDGIGLGFTTVS